MTYVRNRPTVPAPGESSAGWPVPAADQVILQDQRATNQAFWAAETAKAQDALAALEVRTAALDTRVAGDPHIDLDMISAARKQIALEVVQLMAVIAACATGTYSNIVPTVYTLENGRPFVGGGSF